MQFNSTYRRCINISYLICVKHFILFLVVLQMYNSDKSKYLFLQYIFDGIFVAKIIF